MPALKKIGAAALAAFGWTSGGAAAVTANYLVVAGGGSGGFGQYGGGGGAGGYLTSTTSLNPTLTYTVVVGAGATSPSAPAQGANGSNSSLGSIATSTGGGGGGGGYISGTAGSSGGSGGGGAGIGSGAGGAGTSGQGNNGGSGSGSGGGGGGGASAVGSNASGATGGSGGNGSASSISGASVTYAGGGGAYGTSTSGTGGTGGGGNAGTVGGTIAISGTANTGGGGGAAGTAGNAGNGGSGIVIISYAGAQQFGGGIVTSVGGNTIHTFLTSGTLSPLSSLSASYLIVAGGGGSGSNYGGGSGAGGLLTGSGVTIDTNSTYLVTVGAGGAGTSFSGNGNNGGNSSFGLVSTTALGGGAGATYPNSGASGGSGGGAANYPSTPTTGGAGTAGQGNAGGAGTATGGTGGGGGAGAAGTSGSGATSGAGGVGVASSISGTSTFYAGGGGGGGATGAAGGNGGGGTGGSGTANGGNATANTGGGGGGGGGAATGGSGGSGIVIISYAGSSQQMAGGSVTIVGGNVIHTFTSSGYLTPLTYYSNSLRFRSSVTAYLSRTPPVASNRKTWTWSAWVKRGTLGTNQVLFDGYNGTAGQTGNVRFETSNTLGFYTGGDSGSRGQITTSAVFRDPAAWYHIVAVLDTTQATSTNRMKLYVNGVLQTVTVDQTVPQNTDGQVNGAFAHRIGAQVNNVNYSDAYQTNINFIDGQQLTPNSFGTVNSYGVWQPINYGGSYGTNGFYLPFPAVSTSSYAGSFNGSSQYLTLPTSANLQLGTSDYTIEMWVYSTSYGSPVLYDGKTAGGTSIQMYFPSGVANIYGGSGTGTLLITGSAALPTNQWNHIALTRQSSVTKLFINGVQSGSSVTDTTNYNDATSGATIGARFGGANFFSGSMSNFRIVKGTAVYTSNFTPSTTPLTAITNTQLLTLQNATIIDNSTNAFTITNIGSTATSVQYPFSINVFKDQSPAGNNWTPVNISGLNGSTYDYMTDVPTLTSATAANYCVMNPLSFVNGSAPTNGNLKCSNGGTGVETIVNGTMGITTGKFYWEATASGTLTNLQMGIQSAFVATSVSTSTIRGYADSGQKRTGASTYSAYGNSFTNGDVISVAIDMDSGKIWFGKNGTFQASGNPVAGTNAAFTDVLGTVTPWMTTYNTGAGTSNWEYNFGQQPFVYTPPSGFVALNTFNL